MSEFLHPEIAPHETFHLPVGDGHEIYVERVGNPNGLPALVLHGGPGTGASALARRVFDPDHWDVTLYDQRGALRSRPLGCLDHNTTPDLVADIKRLRRHLRIERWLVFGGSWGSALALAYAAAEPTALSGLILRGIYLARRAEDLWQYQFGASAILPEAFSVFRDYIPDAEQEDLIAAYYRRLVGPEEGRMGAARQFLLWGHRTNHMFPDLEGEHLIGADFAAPFVVATARIAAHYAAHGSFLKSDGELIEAARRLNDIPMTIIHGRYDMAVPLSSAMALRSALPHAEFRVVENAGHALGDPAIARACSEALRRHAARLLGKSA